MQIKLGSGVVQDHRCTLSSKLDNYSFEKKISWFSSKDTTVQYVFDVFGPNWYDQNAIHSNRQNRVITKAPLASIEITLKLRKRDTKTHSHQQRRRVANIFLCLHYFCYIIFLAAQIKTTPRITMLIEVTFLCNKSNMYWT